jgi:hypothetical protein
MFYNRIVKNNHFRTESRKKLLSSTGKILELLSYPQHNCSFVFINVNYMVTCFDQRFVIFREVFDIKTK